jgi:hypothetical protein
MHTWEYCGPRTWNNLKTSCHFTKILRAKRKIWFIIFSIFEKNIKHSPMPNLQQENYI